MSRGGRKTNASLIADKNALNRLFKKIEQGQINSLNTELLSQKVPIHFGGMSDPFDSYDTIEISKYFLKTLQEKEYPTILSTKNTSVLLRKDIFEIIKKHKKIIIQVSFSTFSEVYTKILEPNVPNAKQRIKALKILKKFNIPTVVRLQPIFPNLLEDIIEKLIPALNSANIDHLITEHLKLPVEKNFSMIKALQKRTGWDLYSMYKNLGAKLVGREWLLPNEVKYNNILKIVKNLNKNITHSFADYGLQHFGDTECCCGVDKFWDDSNWFKGNIVNSIKSNLNNNIFSIKLLDKNKYPSSSIKRILNSNCRKNDHKTIKDFLVTKWNMPNTVNSPDHLLYINFCGFDENGNCLYKYEKKKEL